MTAAPGVVADPDRAGTAPDPASVVVRGVTVVAVVVVAVIAAVVSYSHMQQLAHAAGEGWRSWLVPLSIDGLVVAASMVLVTRRRSGSGGGCLAWGALGAGVAASLAANMADARPELTAVLVAGWPAVAFAVALELLLQQRRAQHHGTTPTPAPARASVPVAPLPVGGPGLLPPVARHPGSAPAPGAVRPAGLTPAAGMVSVAPVGLSPVAAVPVVVDPLQRRFQALVERVGRVPGRRVVARELGISEHRARIVLERVTPPSPDHGEASLEDDASLNGAGGVSR